MGILHRTKCYTIGHMQYADGKEWRLMVQRELTPLDIVVFDPYAKPFVKDVREGDELRKIRMEAMAREDYAFINEEMRVVRYHDLNLVDRADFIIAHIIPNVASWGSAEELSIAVRMKKPIFLSIEGGKKHCPLWVMGMLNHKYMYNSVEESVDMIKKIDAGTVQIDSDRWRLLRKEFR